MGWSACAWQLVHGRPAMGPWAHASPARLDTRAAAMRRRQKPPPQIWDGASPAPNGEGAAKPGGRGKQLYLGSYDTELDAARVYDRAALAFFKRDAVLNVSAARPAALAAGRFALPRGPACQAELRRLRRHGLACRISCWVLCSAAGACLPGQDALGLGLSSQKLRPAWLHGGVH